MAQDLITPPPLAWAQLCRHPSSNKAPRSKKARPSPKAGIVVMFEACHAGDLGSCQQLWSRGGEETGKWPAATLDGWNLMAVASSKGYLDIAKWLTEVGAPGANWQLGTGGAHETPLHNPVYVACHNGNLPMVKWLFDVGAADNFWDSSSARACVLGAACIGASLDVAVWLLTRGCGNDVESGHVDVEILGEAFFEDGGGMIASDCCVSLRCLLNLTHCFSAIVLPAVRFSPRSSPGSSLQVLRGHEVSLLRLVADFAGVVRGQELRNTREAWMVLDNWRVCCSLMPDHGLD